MSSEDTPIFKQWKNIKSNYENEMLFYRVGDFYELFYEDAKKASRFLDITLTKKRNKEVNVPMAGIPFHASEGYLAKLLKMGESVVICEQVGDASSTKGLMERRVERVLTSGTLTDERFLSDKKENILMAISFNSTKKVCGISNIEISSGRFSVNEVPLNDLLSEIENVQPSEIIIPVGFRHLINLEHYIKKTKFISEEYDFGFCYKYLLNHFNVSNLHSFGCENLSVGIESCVIALEYIQDKYKSGISNISKVERINKDEILFLDKNTRKNLEINFTVDGDYDGSLLSLLDDTHTPMGARNMYRWLNNPLRKKDKIINRQNAIEEFYKNDSESLSELLYDISDIERILARISLRSARPRDLIRLKEFLILMPDIKHKISSFSSPLIYFLSRMLTDNDNVKSLIERSIVDEPPLLIRDGGVIKSTYDDELNEYRELIDNSADILIDMEDKEKEYTGIDKLKVCYNKMNGYYIEVPRSKAEQAPNYYIRKQTLKNHERYTTKELKALEDKMFSAKAKVLLLEKKIYEEILDVINISLVELKSNSNAICEIDVLITLSKKIDEFKLVKPIFKDAFNIKNGRHIVVEKLQSNFTPNDLALDSKNKTIIITGPNMGGKSTYMRQSAIISILAHMGSFVPADYCELPLLDKVFTRIGASDNLSSGLSTFMVEMSETANILNCATKDSLVLLDEIGRGTSTFDGLSIAWSTIKKITNDIKSYTLFSTHYFEITELESTIDTLSNVYLDADFKDGKLRFLHKVKVGSASKSYGIEVAELAGVPDDVIIDARIKLKSLENNDIGKDINSENLLSILQDIVIDDLTPKDALNVLYSIKSQMKKS
jgi:DNA mismatch repair protein MutS